MNLKELMMEAVNLFFIINDERITLEVDPETFSHLFDGDNYLVQYIRYLMRNGLIPEKELLTVQKSKDNINFIQVIEECTEKGEWGHYESKMLLDKYNAYILNVGPMRKFKLKRHMWEQISQDIQSFLGKTYSAVQCENRFKTIIKRKKKVDDLNKKTGESPTDIEFEEELPKISSIDDSIKPPFLLGVGKCKRIENPSTSQETDVEEQLENKPEKKKKHGKIMNKNVIDILMDLHKAKKANRERQHKEKMELLREIGNNLCKKNEKS